VNIGLVEHHSPVLGVIYLLVQAVRYYADVNGSFKRLRVEKPRKICTEKDVYPMVLRAAVARSNFRGAEALFIKRNCVRR
jgi:3'-phosphoadenosine 5'-phosphosulfate (PAPS) 3'-phosphatase